MEIRVLKKALIASKLPSNISLKNIFLFPSTPIGHIISIYTGNDKDKEKIYLFRYDEMEPIFYNHPLGSSLSTGDIRAFLFNQIKELRAIAATDKSIFVLKYIGEPLTTTEIRLLIKEIVKVKNEKKMFSATLLDNSLEVADLYIEQLVKLKNRVEYIHYKKL